MNLNITRWISSIFLSLFIPAAFAQEHLIFAIDLIRHGDRTPTHEIPKSPYHWKEGLGELTPEGMRQEFLLGQSFRKKYVDQYHLLPSTYSGETMTVYSTDVNRTLMSAEALLFGLYPLGTGPALLPEKYQPFPIHTAAPNNDFLTVKPSKNIFSLAKLYFSSLTLWHKKTAALHEKIQRWSEATGLDLNNFRQFGQLADILYIRKIHHIPFPTGISASDADEIISIDNWALTTAYTFKAISYPTGHRILSTIANYVQQSVQKNNSLKYVLISAHDSTIMSVMNTLGAPLTSIPRYASDLNFSVYESDQHYFVKVTFNDSNVNLLSCGKNACSLEEFLKLAKS